MLVFQQWWALIWTVAITDISRSHWQSSVYVCSAFLWRYEPVRRTGKSDDWLTIIARIIRLTVQKFPLFWVIFCIIIFSLNYGTFSFCDLLHFASELKWSRKMRLLSVFYFSSEISITCWLLSRPNLHIVSKLTTGVVTYRYCTEASNQKSKYAYRKIFFYKKSTVCM